MRTPRKVNVVHSFVIIVTNNAGAPVTDLVNANFAPLLARDNALSAQAVTVTEIDKTNLPGWYKVEFTPNAEGYWVCQVKQATYNPAGWIEEIQAYALDPLDLSALVVDGYSIVDALKLIGAATVAKCSGEPTNPVTFRSLDDSADRIASSIDSNGNRTGVVLTP